MFLLRSPTVCGSFLASTSNQGRIRVLKSRSNRAQPAACSQVRQGNRKASSSEAISNRLRAENSGGRLIALLIACVAKSKPRFYDLSRRLRDVKREVRREVIPQFRALLPGARASSPLRVRPRWPRSRKNELRSADLLFRSAALPRQGKAADLHSRSALPRCPRKSRRPTQQVCATQFAKSRMVENPAYHYGCFFMSFRGPKALSDRHAKVRHVCATHLTPATWHPALGT